MTALTVLDRCWAAPREMEEITEKIMMDEYLLGGMEKEGGADQDRTAQLREDLRQLQEDLERRRERESAEKIAVSVLIGKVPALKGLKGRILFAYYVQRKNTGWIAREFRYQAGYIRREKIAAEKLIDMLNDAEVAEALPAWYVREDEKRHAEP